MKRLFDYDPLTGTKETFAYNEATGGFTIETEQDVEPALEFAKAIRNNPEVSKAGIKKGWWHYCHIPDIVILKMNEFRLQRRAHTLVNLTEESWVVGEHD